MGGGEAQEGHAHPANGSLGLLDEVSCVCVTPASSLGLLLRGRGRRGGPR